MAQKKQLLCNKNPYLFTKEIIIVKRKLLIQTGAPQSGSVMSPKVKQWSYKNEAFVSRKWRWILFYAVLQYLQFPEVWSLRHIFALVRYFRTAISLLIDFQNNSNVTVLLLLSSKYIILYHVILRVHSEIFDINNTDIAFLLEMRWCISITDRFLCWE